MRIIGITGGSGSGKSTVSRILHDLGAKVINADRIAREVVHKGSKALKELVEYFGDSILDDKGELNRKKLGTVVFEDNEKLEALNRITHKHISQRIMESIDEARNSGNPGVVVIDAPLPVKEGFLNLVEKVWVVTADKEIRLKRIMDRDGISREDALNRILSQASDEEYLRIADEVLVNNGNIVELEKEVVKLFFRVQKTQGGNIV